MYADVDPTQDTEFHDALRKHGIIPPKPPSRSPSPDLPSASSQRLTKLRSLPLRSLQRHLDNALDSHNAQEVEEIQLILKRRARLEDREKRRNRFGRVYPIGRPDYTREITEASKVDLEQEEDGESDEEEDGEVEGERRRGQDADRADEQNGVKGKRKGTGVVCFLYKDGMPTCELLKGYLDTLAERYPATKFVSIVGDKCIPNYPDKNLPTLLVYRNGELHRQIIGLRPEIGLSGMDTKLQDVELLLTAVGALDRRSAPAAVPTSTHEAGEDADSVSDAGSDESDGNKETNGRSIRNATGTGTGVVGRRTTAKTQEEEDAELDWDL